MLLAHTHTIDYKQDVSNPMSQTLIEGGMLATEAGAKAAPTTSHDRVTTKAANVDLQQSQQLKPHCKNNK